MSASHDFFNMILIQIAGSRSSNRVYRRNLDKYSCLLTEGPNVSCGRGESRQNWSLLAALQMFSRISHTHEPLLVCFLENITISVDQGRIVNVRPLERPSPSGQSTFSRFSIGFYRLLTASFRSQIRESAKVHVRSAAHSSQFCFFISVTTMISLQFGAKFRNFAPNRRSRSHIADRLVRIQSEPLP